MSYPGRICGKHDARTLLKLASEIPPNSFPALKQTAESSLFIVKAVAMFSSNRQDWASFCLYIRNATAAVIQFLWDQVSPRRQNVTDKMQHFLSVLEQVKTNVCTIQNAAVPHRIRPINKDRQSIEDMKALIHPVMKSFIPRPKGAKDFYGDTSQLLARILWKYRDSASTLQPAPLAVAASAQGNSARHSKPVQRPITVSFEPPSLSGSRDAATLVRQTPKISERNNDRLLSPAMAFTTSSTSGGSVTNVAGDYTAYGLDAEHLALKLALDKLSYAEGASWDPKFSCLPGTRKSVLSFVKMWSRSFSSQNVFWVKGVAGSGKTAISHTVAEMLHRVGLLASSFFFNRDVASRNSPQMLITTIARDIANRHPAIAADIRTVLEDELALTSASLYRQFDAFIAGPLRRYTGEPIVIVIDALDESTCDGADNDLLAILATMAADLPRQLRIFVTSRPTSTIEEHFSGSSHIIPHLIDIQSAENVEDISAYVDAQMRDSAIRSKMGPDGIDEALIHALKFMSEGLFIWIATIFGYLRSAYNPKAKLSTLLSRSVPEGLPDVNAKMDALYTAILDTCGAWNDEDFRKDYQLVMGAIMAAKRPLSLTALRALCDDIQELSSKLLLERFGSVLVGFQNDDEPIRILHLSFREFITDRASKAPETIKFFISTKKHSRRLAALCLNTMARELGDKPIIGLGYLDKEDGDSPGIPTLEGVSEQLLYGYFEDTGAIVPHVRYFLLHTCQRWIEIVASRGVFRGSLNIRRWLERHAPDLTILYEDKTQARLLSSLAKRLSYVGRFEEGLKAIQDAADLYRGLAADSEKPMVFRAALSWSLNDISVRLSHQGRREEALSVCTEALDLYRALAAERPSTFNSGLAACLNNVSNYLSDVGRLEEGLTMCQEALSLQRVLAERRPAKRNGNLATSLASLSNRLSAVGRREEALTAIQEAITLYRAIAAVQTTKANTDLALALRSLSTRLSGFGRHGDALEAIQESVDLCRALAAERPRVFNAELANSLTSLSTRLVNLGRQEDGLAAVREAVDLRRALIVEQPEAPNADLALSLENLSSILSHLGRQTQALPAMEEAVALYRALALARPGTYTIHLAVSLNNRSSILLGLLRKREALRAVQEASNILQTLTADGTLLHHREFEMARSIKLHSACMLDGGPPGPMADQAKLMTPAYIDFLCNSTPWDQLDALKDASKRFLGEKDFSSVDLEDVMQVIFGDYATRSASAEATEWAQYWDKLAVYEEALQDNQLSAGPPPSFPGHLSIPDGEQEDTEMDTEDDESAPATPSLLKALDQADAADRAVERAERKKCGNDFKSFRPKAKTGAPANALLWRLAIERTAKNKSGKEVKILQREWPAEFHEASDALLAMSSDSVLSGESAAPKLRGGKRKPSTAGEGRSTPLSNSFTSSTGAAQSRSLSAASTASSFDTPGTSSSHSTAPRRSAPLRQSNLQSSFGVTTPLSPIRQANIDLLLLRLVVCCAISFAMLDNMFFFDFCYALCPAYSIPDRSHFISAHLAAEALSVSKQIQEFFLQFIHLSMSFDGWSSLAHDEIYTVHITTPDRRSFLVDGLVLSGISTTAENLFQLIAEIIERYIATCFSLVVSDTTGNVKKLRRMIWEKWRWILNCPDPCHQLSLMMKDVMVGTKKYPKIAGFAEHVLKDEMRFDSNTRGLQNAGATRFSSFAINAKSIQRCLPTMQRCLEEDTLHFNTKATAHLKQYIEHGTQENFNFQQQLFNIDTLLSPIARGLKTLEGQHTTCSDVFSIFIGIAIGFTRVFQKPTDPIYIHRSETFGVFDRRFKIFMTDCTEDMFILAYLLDPIYYRDRALRLNLPARDNFTSKTVSPLVLRLMNSARLMLQNEQLRMRSGGEAEGNQLIKQTECYMYGDSPFSDPCTEPLHRLAWWKSRAIDSNASIISILAIKLFSVSPSEMCDERTASKMTAFNTAKRNGLTGRHIIQMAQLQSWWTGGTLTSPSKLTHTANLQLPKQQKPTSATAIQLPAPTLTDLLNPLTPQEEALMFDHPDPYGLEFLNDDDEEEEDVLDDGDIPMTTREAGAPRLEIDMLVDLSNKALVDRYNGVKKATPNAAATPASNETSTNSAPWVDRSKSWGPLSF
ncbi:hypothetical protein HWV62_28166 [Athelia sp. TMB]|nr:hypothetical protein HWV62_28166 [Athelia sp. TMB]